MNVCQYCGKENESNVTRCCECGTDVDELSPDTLAVDPIRLTSGRMLLISLWAFFIAMFIPSGVALLLADSSRFASFHPPDFEIIQKTAGGVLLALGLIAVYVGLRMWRRFSTDPTTPTKKNAWFFLFAGLLFLAAMACGLIGSLFLTYIFCGVP